MSFKEIKLHFSLSSQLLMTSNFLPSNHLPRTFSLISYSHRALILLETSPVDGDPRPILHGDILTLLMVSRRSTKIFPLRFYSNEGARGEGQRADQCTNLNNLSPAARVSNTVSWGDYTALGSAVSVFFLFFPACQSGGAPGENRSLHSGWWEEPRRPAFGLQVAGIHRDEPDGRHLERRALHGTHFALSSKIFQGVTTYQLPSH